MIGMGAMLHQLGGGSPKSASQFYGRKVAAAAITDQELRLQFEDGTRIRLWDNGQSCCEARYMRTDDDVASLVGRELRAITVKEGPTESDEYGEAHEVAFVEIQTDGGFVTLANHVEHNGYYGGFGLCIDEVAS